MASAARATLIGDVVGSRRYTDRRRLHRVLNQALRGIAPGAVDPPAFTVGDEFQGSYPTVGSCLDAALRLRLAVAPAVDVRFGLGWGEVTVLDETGIQDGPGWWAARAAIEETAAKQRRPGLGLVRTTFRRFPENPEQHATNPEQHATLSGPNENGPDADAINAALLCRDHLLGSLDGRSLRILTGLMNNHTKKQLAETEGISASAISQRAARDGLDLIVLASSYLRGIP